MVIIISGSMVWGLKRSSWIWSARATDRRRVKPVSGTDVQRLYTDGLKTNSILGDNSRPRIFKNSITAGFESITSVGVALSAISMGSGNLWVYRHTYLPRWAWYCLIGWSSVARLIRLDVKTVGKTIGLLWSLLLYSTQRHILPISTSFSLWYLIGLFCWHRQI